MLNFSPAVSLRLLLLACATQLLSVEGRLAAPSVGAGLVQLANDLLRVLVRDVLDVQERVEEGRDDVLVVFCELESISRKTVSCELEKSGVNATHITSVDVEALRARVGKHDASLTSTIRVGGANNSRQNLISKQIQKRMLIIDPNTREVIILRRCPE